MEEGPLSGEIEERIVALLGDRSPEGSLCPSEAARAVGKAHGVDWRDLMPLTRKVAVRMSVAGRLRITRRDVVLDPEDLGPGPIRLRSPDRLGD